MRVLQVITDTDRRGAQVFACDLHEGFVAAGWTPRTVALAPGAVGGLQVPVLGPSRRHPGTLRHLRTTAARDADVVIAHGSTTLPACAIALAGTGVPFVYRQISDSLVWASSMVKRLRTRQSLQRARRVVALWPGSADVLQRHFGVARDKIDVIPNGSPQSRFQPANVEEKHGARQVLGLHQDRFTALFVGAVVQDKGVATLIEAAQRLPHLQMAVVGDGQDRPALEAQASDNVRFFGSLADVTVAYQAADAFVLPTRTDSMPAAVIEAGLSGLPSITTPIQGIPSIVEDGVTGALIPVDDPSALTTVLEQWMAEPTRVKELGSAARERCAARFSIETITRQWMQTCQRALNDRVEVTAHG